MERNRVHWMGLVSGLLLIAVIGLSFVQPWWQLRVGDLGYANVSVLNTTVSFLDITFLVPILTALNLSSLLLLALSAAFMLVYSLNATKPYAKPLLHWSSTKPLIVLLTFLGGLVVLSQLVPYLASQFAQLDVTLPLMGTSLLHLPSEMLGGVSGVQVGIAISGMFQWTFFLAVVAAVLCVASRIHYGRASFLVDPRADTNGTELVNDAAST